MSDTILIPKDTPDWQEILSGVETAKDTAVSAKDTAVSAKDTAQNSANNLGSLGGIDGTVQDTADLPSASNHTDEFWYVVDKGSYYKSDGSNWNKTSIDIAGLNQTQKWTSQQDFISTTTKEGPFFNVTHQDYGGGISDNGSSIQAAFNNTTSTNWSTVLIPDVGGEWVIDSSVLPLKIPSKTILVIKAELKIGDGANSPLFVNESSNLNRADNGGDSDIWILGRGAKINGNSSNVTANSSTAAFNAPIVADQVDRFRMIGVEIFNSLTHGLFCYGGSDIHIRNNYVRDGNSSGLHTEWKSISGGEIDRVFYHNNYVKNVGGPNNAGNYFISGVNTAIVTENISKNGVNSGIKVQSSARQSYTGDMRNVIVANNIIYEFDGDNSGQPSYGIRVREQSAENVPLHRVIVSNNIVDGYNGSGSVQWGIRIGKNSTGENVDDVILSNNHVANLSGNNAGINLISFNEQIKNVQVLGCVVSDVSGHCLQLNNTTRSLINSCVFRNSGSSIVRFRGGLGSNGVKIKNTLFESNNKAIRSTDSPTIAEISGCTFNIGNKNIYTQVNSGIIENFTNNDLEGHTGTVFDGTFPIVKYIAGNIGGLNQIDSGTFTLPGGNTSVQVSIDIDYTTNIKLEDIQIVPLNDWADLGAFWISNLTGSAFNLNGHDGAHTGDKEFAYKVVHQDIRR